MSVPVNISRKYFSRSKVQVCEELPYNSHEVGGDTEPDEKKIEQDSSRATEDPFADLKNGGALVLHPHLMMVSGLR